MNSLWLATSARYAKTSSRGRPITSETSTASTAGRLLLGGVAQHANGGPAALAADRLGALRGVGAQHPAQFAHHDAAAVVVTLLSNQRGAPAVTATVAPGVHQRHALAEQLALEVRFGEMVSTRHCPAFAGQTSTPCERGVLPNPNNGYLIAPTRSVALVRLRHFAQAIKAGPVIDTVVMIVTS